MPNQVRANLFNPAMPIAAGLIGLVVGTPITSLAQSFPSPRLPSVAPVQAAPVQAEMPYTLGAGDRLQVDIFQVPQYSGEVEVLVDGTVNLAVAGRVSVDGLTIDQASAAISSAYSRILRRPIVTLGLLGRRQLQIGIAGEVNRPGSYAIAPDTAQFPTLTEVLELAGGTTQAADVRQVRIRRPTRSGTADEINVDLWNLLQSGDLNYDITLRDGDQVFIPTTTVALNEAPLLAAASFAAETNQPINIAIVGEVFRPGPYTLTGGTARTGDAGVPGGAVGTTNAVPTVTRAIQIAGGIKPLADVRRVQVRRLTRSGAEQVFEVNLWDLLKAGDLRQDAILQEGDTVVVPTVPELDPTEAAAIASASFSPDSIRVNVVGEVTSAGTIELPPNTPLNQAILAAGGFNNRARRATVQLIRLNVDGTVSRQELPIDLAQGIDSTSNPALQNNDVVIVSRTGLARVSDTLNQVLQPLGGAFSLFELPFRFIRIFD